MTIFTDFLVEYKNNLTFRLWMVLFILLTIVLIIALIVNVSKKRKFKRNAEELFKERDMKNTLIKNVFPEEIRNLKNEFITYKNELIKNEEGIKRLSNLSYSINQMEKFQKNFETEICNLNLIVSSINNYKNQVSAQRDSTEAKSTYHKKEYTKTQCTDNKVTQNPDVYYAYSLYIVEGKRQCFKCGKEIPVVALATDDFVYNNKLNKTEDKLYIIGYIDKIFSDELTQLLKDKYKYSYCFSKTTNSRSFGNHCVNCGVLQGNYFLHDEPSESPFYFDSDNAECVLKAQQLKLHKVNIKTPIEIDCSIVIWQPDYSNLIKKYAQYDEVSADEVFL